MEGKSGIVVRAYGTACTISKQVAVGKSTTSAVVSPIVEKSASSATLLTVPVGGSSLFRNRRRSIGLFDAHNLSPQPQSALGRTRSSDTPADAATIPRVIHSAKQLSNIIIV